jgi:antitoxin YefM
VTRIAVMTTTSLANVKAHLSAFVTSVHDTHDRVTITRNGEPAAVLIAPDDLESLEETISILSDPQAMADIRESDAAIAAGDVMSLEDFLAERRKHAQQ